MPLNWHSKPVPGRSWNGNSRIGDKFNLAEGGNGALAPVFFHRTYPLLLSSDATLTVLRWNGTSYRGKLPFIQRKDYRETLFLSSMRSKGVKSSRNVFRGCERKWNLLSSKFHLGEFAWSFRESFYTISFNFVLKIRETRIVKRQEISRQ